MTAPPSPPLLAPPPKRAPGVVRLNNVPYAIGAGVVVIFLCGVGYTMVQRHLATQAAAAQAATEAAKPTGAKPPGFLATGQDHGEIQASVTGPLGRKNTPGSTPWPTTPQTPTATPTVQPVSSGLDLDEQARVRAWNVYYQQQAEMQAARIEMERRAFTGGTNPMQGRVGSPGQIPPPGDSTAPGQPPNGAAHPAYSVGGTDPGGQTGKQAFLRTSGDIYGSNEDLAGSVHGPKPLTIMEGTPLPGRLVDAATSDMPGQLVAEVTTNVYDDMTGLVLLVPQWSRIIMTYDIAVSTGQNRVGVISQRLVFPDTSSRQLGSMQVADQAGMAGLKDVLDTHFWEKFGSALAVSLIGAGAQVAQPQQSAFSATSPSSAATGAFTQNMSQFGIEQARAGQSRPNTIELRSGLELTIKPNHDITLPPYVGERGAGPANLISARWKQ